MLGQNKNTFSWGSPAAFFPGEPVGTEPFPVGDASVSSEASAAFCLLVLTLILPCEGCSLVRRCFVGGCEDR